MTRARLAALLLTSVCLGVAVGCGSGEEPLAKVDGTRIEREDVESLIELYKSRAEAREGEADENGKEKVSHPQEVGALHRRRSRSRGLGSLIARSTRHAEGEVGMSSVAGSQTSLKAHKLLPQPRAAYDLPMYNEYRFVDRWFVRAPLEAVYEIVGDTLGYPGWWGDVFVGVEGDAGPPRPGRNARIVSRGFLPYLLRWEAQVVDADAPRGFAFTMTGDFVGSGSWTFDSAHGGTSAVFDFRPRVEKPGVKQLSPVLKPLFRWNHRWAMQRGQRGVNALFEHRTAAG